MLKILSMRNHFCSPDATGEQLYKQNSPIQFDIFAPLYWWVDCDWVKYYFHMPLDNFEFCFDNPNDFYSSYIKIHLTDLDERDLMQALPLATMVKGTIELTYREVLEVCENYISGEYHHIKNYGFPNEREWKDFCETLLDINGIRDLVEDE